MSKSNPVGKNLVIVVVVLAVALIILKNRDGNDVDVAAALQAEDTSVLGETETYEGVTIKTGADGDTYVDTLSTVTAKIEQLEKDKKEESDKKEALLKQNRDLNNRVNQANNNTQETKTSLEKLIEKVSNLENNLKEARTSKNTSNKNVDRFASRGEYPIKGNGIPKLNSPNVNAPISEADGTINYDDSIVWINPIDAQSSVDDKGVVSLEIPDISIGDTLRNTELYKEVADTGYGRSVGMEQNEEEVGVPYITIPRGSTSIDGVALTALIGRIPTGGAVVDPYRFKALISSENLASNGIVIDGLSGAVIGGRATGDYALECVNGEIDYITFTFEEGRISTFPEASGEGDSNSVSLGYISDNAGVQCIAGKFISNGASYLAQQVGLATLNAGAEAYSQSATAITSSPEGSTSTVTDSDKFALGGAVTAGIDTASDWLTQRQQSAFDAVYVAPSSRITVHFEREISINYNPNGRKTNHADFMQVNKNGYDYTGLN